MENNEVKENQEVNKGEETPQSSTENTNENKENHNTDSNQESNETKKRNENQECNENEGSGDQGEGRKTINYSVNMAIIGGVVGAGIGLLANQETSKKVIKNLSESELVKTAGNEFKKTAQELLAGQAQNSMKKVASGYINKFEEGLLNTKRGGSGADKEQYEEIKEENKQLNDRLDKIEQMLSNLVESK